MAGLGSADHAIACVVTAAIVDTFGRIRLSTDGTGLDRRVGVDDGFRLREEEDRQRRTGIGYVYGTISSFSVCL